MTGLPSRNNDAARAEKLLQTGMIAAIRDMQAFMDGRLVVHAQEINAFLLTQLIACGVMNESD